MEYVKVPAILFGLSFLCAWAASMCNTGLGVWFVMISITTGIASVVTGIRNWAAANKIDLEEYF